MAEKLSMKRIFITLVILLSVIVNFIPSNVYALTQTRAVNGAATILSGSVTYAGAGTTGTFADLNSDDGDNSYVANADYEANKIVYPMQTFSTAVSHINSVTIYLKGKCIDSGGTGGNAAIYNGVTSITQYMGGYAGGAYNLLSYTWTTDPLAGGDWTAAHINSYKWGFYQNILATNITYMYISIDYDPLVVPLVTATAPTTYTGTSATLIGNITGTGGVTPDNYGFVWGTVDQGDPGNFAPADGIGGWTKGWAVGAGSYGVAQYTHATGATLVINTTYYIRFAAHNSIGWEYSSVVSFRTLANPSITTLAATNIASSVARFNASVVDDGKLGGGENCTVDFVYVAGNYATYALISGDGAHLHVAVTGTHNTGGLPYYDITGLALGTQYSFAASITNSISTQYGNPALQFTTETAVNVPTNFIAIPTSTTVSLSWVKGVGAANTFIRYDTSTYPILTTGGLATVYAGVGNSYLVTGLTPGQNYYFSAWGLTTGFYSASYISVLATCLSTDPAVVPTLPIPTTPGSWNLTPSTSAISNMPFSEFANYFADAYDMPQTTMWYGLIIMFSVGAGLFVYWRGNNNLLAAMLVCAIGLAIGAIVWGLVYLWVLVFFLMAGVAMIFFGWRYPN